MYAVIFEDIEDSAAIRSAHIQAHLSFLEEHATQIECAGPLVDDEGVVASGLWLVKASRFADVEMLVELDPFWSAGLRKSVLIRHWRRVFAEGRRL